MTNRQVSILTNQLSTDTSSIEVKETHISWIILTDTYAYKIKKPVSFSFLDFSTLEKRKYYCQQEVQLNQRLASDIYLKVVPICIQDSIPSFDKCEGYLLDYAVKMIRLDNQQEMSYLLEQGGVTEEHILQLVDQLSTFHAFADVVNTTPTIFKFQNDFKDILKVKDIIAAEISESAAQTIEEAVTFSAQFLQTYQSTMLDRYQKGFFIDGHGDLHSGNIFLLEEPVIFDCIEFNSKLRELDVLDELAFLCMDLEYYGRDDLAVLFLQQYNRKYPVLIKEEDRLLFQYYKLYRANVRLKVSFIKSNQATTTADKQKYIGIAEDYLQLFTRYLVLLQEQAKIDISLSSV